MRKKKFTTIKNVYKKVKSEMKCSPLIYNPNCHYNDDKFQVQNVVHDLN